jgi:predicted nucleic acid-binding protein
MTRVVMDTSALISLELIGLIEKALKIIEIIIPEAVKDELKELSDYKDKEGESAKKILGLLKKGKIKVVKIKNRKKAKEILSKNVDYGESECIISCIENDIDVLIMDDVSAAYELEGLAISKDIKLKISVAVLIELQKERVINKKQLLDSIKKLIKTREWEGGVLEILSKKYLENF